MGKLDVIERAANRLLQHNVAEARIAIELMQESHDQRVLIKSYLVPILYHFSGKDIYSILSTITKCSIDDF